MPKNAQALALEELQTLLVAENFPPMAAGFYEFWHSLTDGERADFKDGLTPEQKSTLEENLEQED